MQIEIIQKLSVVVVFDVVRLYGVDSSLDDCPRALGGEEAVQELGKCH